jgi:hypothetical protein
MVTPRILTQSAAFFLLLLCAPLAAADVISGRVVDSQGQGVAGADIDVEDLIGGGDPGLMDGGTDANGFFTATLPSGLYRVTFTPPAPPFSTHLMAQVDSVAVVGTLDMGIITLPPGVSLAGRQLDGNGLPVQNVDLDVIDEATGIDLDVPGDVTNAFGQFLIAVPPSAIEVQFETANVLGPLLAPRALRLLPTTNLDLGDLVLEPGFTVAGTVRDTLSSPVQAVDLDVVDSFTGLAAFTPGDHTDLAGNFSFVVAAGTWNFEVCPNPADRLVATEQTNVTITANTNVGVVTLSSGVRLFGTIRDGSGDPVSMADTDVNRTSNGAPLLLCGDNSDSSGNYSVIVPTGTFTVIFSRPDHLVHRSDVHLNVVVTGDMRLDGTLASCPCSTLPFGGPINSAGAVSKSRRDRGDGSRAVPFGSGRAGSEGITPRLRLVSGVLELSGGIRGGTAILSIGPRKSLRSSSASRVVLALDESGAASLSLSNLPRGVDVYVRFVVIDPAAPGGHASSRGLRIRLGA